MYAWIQISAWKCKDKYVRAPIKNNKLTIYTVYTNVAADSKVGTAGTATRSNGIMVGSITNMYIDNRNVIY